MKNKPWLKYLIYLLLIFSFAYLDWYIGKLQTDYQSKTYDIGIIYSVISMIVRIFIGFILGLEYIANESKNEGKWEINLPKFILVVIPSLYFSLLLFLQLIPNKFLLNILKKPVFMFIIMDLKFTFLFQILLGYFFITSFYKQGKGTPN